MTRKDFIRTSVLLAGMPLPVYKTKATALNEQCNVRLLRHATLLVTLGNLKLLVDPMFAAKGAMDPVANAGNDIRIPMFDMPISKQELHALAGNVDAVLVTHLHRDHWDKEAQTLIDKTIPVFCQPVDKEQIQAQGFQTVIAIEESVQWKNLTIHRTGGHHGSGDIEKLMGKVSGFVITANDKSMYIAGDTVWCSEVKEALETHNPCITVLNCGGARFLTGGPITMDEEDVISCCRAMPNCKFIAVQMDTLNHCNVTRKLLYNTLAVNNLTQNVMIPADGEDIYW